jgi:hypothetical protein
MPGTIYLPIMVRKSDIPTGQRLREVGLTEEQRLIIRTPEGSIPERMVYGWLRRHKIPFRYQQSVMGGRVPGGAIIDFVIEQGITPIALRVMGYHWHTLPGQRYRDDIQREALENNGFRVVDAWDYEVNTYDRVNATMNEVMYGINLRNGLTGGTADPIVGSHIIETEDIPQEGIIW